jgi:hypothetical protein
MTTGEDAHGCDYFTQVFLSPELCNSITISLNSTDMGIRYLVARRAG